MMLKNKAALFITMAILCVNSYAISYDGWHPYIDIEQKTFHQHDEKSQVDATHFSYILNDNALYSFLMDLEKQEPLSAKSVEYVGLLNEVHKTNQTLNSLLIEVKRSNQLQHVQCSFGGTTHG